MKVQLFADKLRLRRYYADGAGKLVGQHIRKYQRDNKSTRTTKITWTPWNTPEMNSLYERTNRTVKEMALALLLDSGLPSVFAGERATGTPEHPCSSGEGDNH